MARNKHKKVNDKENLKLRKAVRRKWRHKKANGKAARNALAKQSNDGLQKPQKSPQNVIQESVHEVKESHDQEVVQESVRENEKAECAKKKEELQERPKYPCHSEGTR